jgi:cation diffusion facilitator family transporter
MQHGDIGHWRHDHSFGLDRERHGERRTRWVVAITVAMMVAEIAAGLLFGSMALLADGWHMGTHAAAIGIAMFAYAYARKHAGDPRYSFGTGKVGALGGFASAVGLAVVALLVLYESLIRLASPVQIRFDEAIAVAAVGLVVNLACALLLREREHEHGHEDHEHQHRDHNLRAAYFHVLADALTSVLALIALFAGKLFGWTWMDPMMGVIGSLVIARWSLGLLRDTSAVLLDAEVDEERIEAIRQAIENDGECRVTDLHVWRVGPWHLAVIVSIVATDPCEPSHYRDRLVSIPDLAHISVEVHRCAEADLLDEAAAQA